MALHPRMWKYTGPCGRLRGKDRYTHTREDVVKDAKEAAAAVCLRIMVFGIDGEDIDHNRSSTDAVKELSTKTTKVRATCVAFLQSTAFFVSSTRNLRRKNSLSVATNGK